MRSRFGSPRTTALTPRRALLVLAGACAALLAAIAVLVLSAVLSASAVVIELLTTTAVVMAMLAGRALQPAAIALRDSRRTGVLVELQRDLASLPETPHPLGL
jgi:hypothetical protein